MIYAIDNKKRLVRKITKEEIVDFFNNNHSKRNRFTYIADKTNAKRYIQLSVSINAQQNDKFIKKKPPNF